MKLPLLFLGLIGISSAAMAVDNATTKSAPELTTVRAALKAKNYPAALAELKGMLVMYQIPMSIISWVLLYAKQVIRPRP